MQEMIDLNELPDDLNWDLPANVGVDNIEPMYCTQPSTQKAPPLNNVHEFMSDSPNPPTTQNVADPAMQAMHTEEHTLDDTDTLGATGGTAGHEGAGGDADNDDEVWSQPKEPSLGTRFDTLQGAREHYNAYAQHVGFSIKMNTSRRSTVTGEIDKYQFVCNKFRKPKNDDHGTVTAPSVEMLEDPYEGGNDDDGEDNVIVFADDAADKKKKRKKRKREKIIQTGCKAKMIVKLIDGRWEVTYFIAEHNHPLIEKPSLTKYLRSHQGIPPEEKLFLKNLHNCNLTTGEWVPLEKSCLDLVFYCFAYGRR